MGVNVSYGGSNRRVLVPRGGSVCDIRPPGSNGRPKTGAHTSTVNQSITPQTFAGKCARSTRKTGEDVLGTIGLFHAGLTALLLNAGRATFAPSRPRNISLDRPSPQPAGKSSVRGAFHKPGRIGRRERPRGSCSTLPVDCPAVRVRARRSTVQHFASVGNSGLHISDSVGARPE
jgi:hypothetical protein